MPESITPLLAERLDIPEEQAQSLLETMVRELRQRTETDAVQLSGLGTFREEEGTLVFQPGPSLRRRVNRQFEGLSAEPLAPTDADAEGTPPSGQSTPEPTDTPESADSEPPPFMQSPPAPDEPEEAPEATEAEAAGDGDTSGAQDRRPTDRDQPGDRSPDSFTIISLVLLVLFVLGAGWFVLNRTNVWGPSPTTSTPNTTQSPTASDGPTTASDSEPPSQSDESPSDEAEEAAPPPSSQGADAPAQNWTIIVASRSSRSAAQEVADAYAPRFDSVAVVAGTVDNTTWYRVAIGQYSSEADAEQALTDQSDALPSDAWTHRLR